MTINKIDIKLMKKVFRVIMNSNVTVQYFLSNFIESEKYKLGKQQLMLNFEIWYIVDTDITNKLYFNIFLTVVLLHCIYYFF